MSMQAIAIRFDAGNDRNGNPRRVYVILDCKSGNIIETVDEGYQGRGCLPRWLDEEQGIAYDLKDGGTFATTPREYRNLLKINRKNSPYFVSVPG